MMDRRSLLAMLMALAPAAAFAQANHATALNGQHPSAYYQKAAELLKGNRKDDAVFIFYLGQLRYRTHLAARPDLPKSGDPALFGSLSEVVGRPVNEYAFGDIPRLLMTLDEVMAFDRSIPDAFTAPGQYPDAHKRIRDGMQGFRRQMEAQAHDIKRQRAANGLENRW
jgi:hypothetical protein